MIYALLLAFFLPTISSGQSELIFTLTWQNGYWKQGNRSEMVPVGYFTDGTTNVDPQSDGTAVKRWGRTRDYAAAGGDTSVNLLAELRNSQKYYPYRWGLVAAGDKWYKRSNQGSYTALSPPVSVVTGGLDDLQAVEFENELIIGGDISVLSHFDGDSLSRLIIPMPADTLAGKGTTLTGGSLDSGVVNWYFWTWVNRQGKETYRSGPIKCTETTATAKKCSVYAMPIYPPFFSNTQDTMQIVKRMIYVSRDSGATGMFWKALPPRTTSFVDSGQIQFSVGSLPRERGVVMAGHYPNVFQSQLWFVTSQQIQRSPYRLLFAIGSASTTASIYPSIQYYSMPFKASAGWDGGPQMSCQSQGGGMYLCTVSNGGFISGKVIPGDYAIVSSGTGSLSARVLSVLTNSTIILDTDFSGQTSSIGNNIYQIDDEIVGFGYTYTSTWKFGNTLEGTVLARGLFGTTAASHSANASLFLVDPRSPWGIPGRSLVNSENFNPLRQQNAEDPFVMPISDITGMFIGNGYLGIVGNDRIYSITGTEEFSVYPLSDNVGSVSSRAITSIRNGACVLDDTGPYYIDDQNQLPIGRALGESMRDSAAAGYYERASSYFFRNKLYMSIVQNASTKACITYVADFNRQTEDGQPIWTRYSGWNPKSWTSWENTNRQSELYFGEWDTATVFKADPTVKYDATSANTQDSITVRVTSPTMRIPGSYTTWDRISLLMDTNDSVTVWGTFSAGPTTYSRILRTIKKADSSAADGIMREWNIDVSQSSDTFQITVHQKSKTGRFVLGPIRVYGTAGKRR